MTLVHAALSAIANQATDAELLRQARGEQILLDVSDDFTERFGEHAAFFELTFDPDLTSLFWTVNIECDDIKLYTTYTAFTNEKNNRFYWAYAETVSDLVQLGRILVGNGFKLIEPPKDE